MMGPTTLASCRRIFRSEAEQRLHPVITPTVLKMLAAAVGCINHLVVPQERWWIVGTLTTIINAASTHTVFRMLAAAAGCINHLVVPQERWWIVGTLTTTINAASTPTVLRMLAAAVG